MKNINEAQITMEGKKHRRKRAMESKETSSNRY